MSELMPLEIRTARFQLLIPTSWNKVATFRKNLKPICIHLAGTGDHVRLLLRHKAFLDIRIRYFFKFFWRRRLLLAKPLIDEHSIGSIILENPFYGVRKPKEQT